MDSRRGTLFFMVALVVVVIAAAHAVHASVDNSVSLADLGITPQPVYSGSNVSLRFQLYNSYQNSISNVDMYLQGSYPILNYSPQGTTLISSLGEGLYGGVGSYFGYNLHIPQNVQAGTYTINVVLTYQLTESSGTSTPGESIIPISFYVTGMPSISLNANPSSQVSPGETSTISITGINTGTDQAENVSVEVLSGMNFTVVGPDSFSLGDIADGGSAQGSVSIEANSTISSGQHMLKAVLKYGNLYGRQFYKNVSIMINVPVDKPDIVASIDGATPQYLYAGSNQTIELAIQNTGSGTARNVSIEVPGSGYITVGSSSSDFFIGSIDAGSTVYENVFITASRNGNATSYGLPIQIKYLNANYQNPVNFTQSIPITMQRAAQFNVTAEDGSLEAGSTFVPVTFRLKNTGNEAAQQVTVSLEAIYPLSPADANFYVSELQPGQTANVTFYVNVDTNGNPGTYPVTLYEQWSQPNGASSQQYSGSTNYYADVQSSGSATGSYTEDIAVVVIVAIAAGFIYMRRRKAKAAAARKAAAKQHADEEDRDTPARKKR